MKKISYRAIFNRNKKLNSEGKGLVQIECYLDRKRKYLSTGIKIEPIYWNSKLNIIKNNHPEHIELNRFINKQIRSLEDYEFKQVEKKGLFSLKEINGFSHERISNNDSFLAFFKENMQNNPAIQNVTRKQHNAIYNKLMDFNSALTFDDVDYDMVKMFDNFLRTKDLHINTIANHHKILKTYINLAIKKKLYNLENYPYKQFKAKKIQTKRTFLSIDEVKKIEDLKFTENTIHIEKVRDMFVFSCYTGLRFSDVQNLKNRDILKNNGEYIIEFKQNKTQGYVKLPISLLFNGKAVNIVKKYKENYADKFLFPRISNQKANVKLKVVALVTDIDKSLSFHVSRHTFGTNLATATSDQFLIRELMGHSDIRTSMIYIHTSQEQIRNKLKNTKWD